jgi:hypothetical protein
MAELTILDPRAEIGVAITPYALSIDITRPGLRVALLSNGFFDASKLLNAVGTCLTGRLKGARTKLYEYQNPSLTATAEVIAEIARDNDVAVTALGHCGSCTSSATRNAVSLARAGVPVTALISEKFFQGGAFVARSVGMPDVPRVQLPHPVSGTGTARIAAIAEGAAPHIIAAWRGAHERAA